MLTLETPVDHGPRDDWLDGERADLLIDLFGGDVSDFSDVSRFKLNGVVEKSSWLDENTVDEVFGVVLGQRKLDLEVLGLARLVIPNAFQASKTRNSRLFQCHANRSVSAPRLFPGLLELLSKNPRSRIPARCVCVCVTPAIVDYVTHMFSWISCWRPSAFSAAATGRLIALAPCSKAQTTSKAAFIL